MPLVKSFVSKKIYLFVIDVTYVEIHCDKSPV